MGATDRILIVGCGNMGGAMLAGWLAGGLDPARFTVVDPMLAAAPAGVRLLRALPQGEVFGTLLLGVKPQQLGALAPALAPLAGPEVVVLSILAGADLATLAAQFPAARALVRVMPNLSAAIGKSPLGLTGLGVTPQLRGQIDALLAPLGTAEWVEEGLMEAVTALAGSGPAFVYRFIDALAAGGVALGLDPDQAARLANATVEGAALLAAGADVPPVELARRVTSPGGTTAAGLAVLDEGAALAGLVAATMSAAAARTRELAEIARTSASA